MKSNVPFFIEIMNAVSGKNLGMENTELDVRVKFCFLYSVLINERWHELSLLKRVRTGHKVQRGMGYEKLGVGHYFLTR